MSDNEMSPFGKMLFDCFKSPNQHVDALNRLSDRIESGQVQVAADETRREDLEEKLLNAPEHASPETVQAAERMAFVAHSGGNGACMVIDFPEREK